MGGAALGALEEFCRRGKSLIDQHLTEVPCPDEKLVAGCFGEAESGGTDEEWVVISKSGFALILARHERHALAFENGYRALRWGGRFVRKFLKLTSRSSFWTFLPKRKINRSPDCLLSRLEAHFQGKAKAILFGNPVQVHRRAMIQLLQDDGHVIMIKSGFTPEAIKSIRREAGFLQLTGIDPNLRPRVLGTQFNEKEAWLALEWLAGSETMSSKAIERAAVRFLRRLRVPREHVVLEDLEDWDSGEHRFPLPAQLRKRNLVKTATHGDFALWNLLRRGLHLAAVDWEWSRESGIAGLDLVHLHYQDAAMVKGLDDFRLTKHVLKRLNRDVSRVFLLDCGWHKVEEVLVVYLATLNPIFKGVSQSAYQELVDSIGDRPDRS